MTKRRDIVGKIKHPILDNVLRCVHFCPLIKILIETFACKCDSMPLVEHPGNIGEADYIWAASVKSGWRGFVSYRLAYQYTSNRGLGKYRGLVYRWSSEHNFIQCFSPTLPLADTVVKTGPFALGELGIWCHRALSYTLQCATGNDLQIIFSNLLSLETEHMAITVSGDHEASLTSPWPTTLLFLLGLVNFSLAEIVNFSLAAKVIFFVGWNSELFAGWNSETFAGWNSEFFAGYRSKQ